MGKVLLPVLLLIVSAAIFFGFTDKQYQEIKRLKIEEAQLAKALDDWSTLASQIQGLTDVKKNIVKTNLDKLESLLPDSIDNIRLILDIAQIAEKHGLAVKNVRVGDITKAAAGNSTPSDTTPLGTVTISFSVSAEYDTFRQFIRDVEKSERLVDIVSITLKNSDTGKYEYNITLRTYWLK
ncbi:MAG: type 4a pilus biogenesis protein PilO [Patescibacteria group bacterium]